MDAYIDATVAALLEGTAYPPTSMRTPDSAVSPHQRTVWGSIQTMSNFVTLSDPITETTLKLAYLFRDHLTVTVPYSKFLSRAAELANTVSPRDRSFIDAAICIYAYYTEHVRSTHPCHPKSRARVASDGICVPVTRIGGTLRAAIHPFTATILHIVPRDLFTTTPHPDPSIAPLRAAISEITSFVDYVDTLSRVSHPVAIAYNTVTLLIDINLQTWSTSVVTLQNMHISSLAILANAITAAPFRSVHYQSLAKAETALRASIFFISSSSSRTTVPILSPSYLRPISLPHPSPSMPTPIPL